MKIQSLQNKLATVQKGADSKRKRINYTGPRLEAKQEKEKSERMNEAAKELQKLWKL
jgi:peptidoglycan hydrolase CwlO-like protein